MFSRRLCTGSAFVCALLPHLLPLHRIVSTPIWLQGSWLRYTHTNIRPSVWHMITGVDVHTRLWPTSATLLCFAMAHDHRGSIVEQSYGGLLTYSFKTFLSQPPTALITVTKSWTYLKQSFTISRCFELRETWRRVRFANLTLCWVSTQTSTFGSDGWLGVRNTSN